MPRKKNPETPKDQNKRFRAKVRELIDGGELNPDEAGAALDALVRRSIKEHGA